ncbi:hypothetical protein MAR_013513 [Mya arenaria]|uniref:Uncharacterized protein n=1 Tax=Mya arenaria TaxID=6604 RepID=A0ABY7G2Q6_MYAAR|nr:hypothetical protein MAR_013513 [Mya arenaria]
MSQNQVTFLWQKDVLCRVEQSSISNAAQRGTSLADVPQTCKEPPTSWASGVAEELPDRWQQPPLHGRSCSFQPMADNCFDMSNVANAVPISFKTPRAFDWLTRQATTRKMNIGYRSLLFARHGGGDLVRENIADTVVEVAMVADMEEDMVDTELAVTVVEAVTVAVTEAVTVAVTEAVAVAEVDTEVMEVTWAATVDTVVVMEEDTVVVMEADTGVVLEADTGVVTEWEVSEAVDMDMVEAEWELTANAESGAAGNRNLLVVAHGARRAANLCSAAKGGGTKLVATRPDSIKDNDSMSFCITIAENNKKIIIKHRICNVDVVLLYSKLPFKVLCRSVTV